MERTTYKVVFMEGRLKNFTFFRSTSPPLAVAYSLCRDAVKGCF